MSYSVIGIIAILLHLIINRDVLWRKSTANNIPAYREYRFFIIGILIFCVTDVLWGIFNEYHLITPLYAVTVAYFVTMMIGFLAWTKYVVSYLEINDVRKKIINILGITLFLIEMIILAVNFFIPIQFRFDESGVYHAGFAWYLTLALQVVLFIVTSVYTFISKAKTTEATLRLRRTVGIFCLTMAALIVCQIFFPYLPLYSIGYLLGSCLLHSFVVEDEKEEYRKTLEKLLEREKQQNLELGSARRRINTDPLTGAKSKQAYLDDRLDINRRIKEGGVSELGAVVFDLNDLKYVNDNMGHETGDIYIYNAFMLISEFFCHSPVYRIGGDEFAAILRGDDYNNREELLKRFDAQVESNLKTGRVVVSSGMSEFIPGTDKKLEQVLDRADKKMYKRKQALKKLGDPYRVPAVTK